MSPISLPRDPGISRRRRRKAFRMCDDTNPRVTIAQSPYSLVACPAHGQDYFAPGTLCDPDNDDEIRQIGVPGPLNS